MSSSVLARVTGVHRTDAHVDELETASEELGWRTVVLDGAEAEDTAAFLEVCSEAFALPEWFGLNWDALEECLADLDLGGVDGVIVLWVSWSEFAEAQPRDFAVAVDVLASAVRGWARDGIRGGVLLVGGGQQVGVDEL